MRLTVAGSIVLLLAAAACGGADDSGPADGSVSRDAFIPSDASFQIDGAVTELTWADVRPTFVTYCLPCHGQPALNKKLEDFRFDKYDAADPVAPVNDDLGVYELRGNVYEELVVRGSMPPMSADQPNSAEVAEVAEWIEAGAPGEWAATVCCLPLRYALDSSP